MSVNIDRFRLETRAWLQENCPPSMRTPMVDEEMPWGGRKAKFPNPDTKIWLDRMVSKGWTAPTWPVEYGGGGLNEEHASVLKQELDSINARQPLYSFGHMMLGPVLLQLGTEAQKRRFLPSITKGEIRWCQGYSEPNAGSDLAGLKTRAELKDNHFIINGGKTWTSFAHESDWIFCLVRTDQSKPKHQGISFILFDLESEGVERRPFDLISGETGFCSEFFDDVRVPKENLVGELNDGWRIAKLLLQYERQNVGRVLAEFDNELATFAKRYTDNGSSLSPVLRERIAEQKMHAETLGMLMDRVERESDGNSTGFLSSVVKVAMADTNQMRGELMMETMGNAGLGWQGDEYHADALQETRTWLRGKANSIEGGSSEINLNIIAKRILGLPDPR